MQKKVVYGGWWIIEWIGRRVVAHTKCQAPDLRLYREDFERRLKSRTPSWSLYLENAKARQGAIR